jgi:hypothetical protein
MDEKEAKDKLKAAQETLAKGMKGVTSFVNVLLKGRGKGKDGN